MSLDARAPENPLGLAPTVHANADPKGFERKCHLMRVRLKTLWVSRQLFTPTQTQRVLNVNAT
jgi:hypothetical protein